MGGSNPTRPDPVDPINRVSTEAKSKAAAERRAQEQKIFPFFDVHGKKDLGSKRSSRAAGEGGAILGTHHQTLDRGLGTKRKREKEGKKEKIRKAEKKEGTDRQEKESSLGKKKGREGGVKPKPSGSS